MIRCTIELISAVDSSRNRVIGLVEIANDGTGTEAMGNYTVLLKKTPPFTGALFKNWKRGTLPGETDDAPVIIGEIIGHHRTRRGVYDLLFRGLRACGLAMRNS